MTSSSSHPVLQKVGDVSSSVLPTIHSNLKHHGDENAKKVSTKETISSICNYVRHRLFDMYKKLFTAVFLLNFGSMIWVCFQWTEPTLDNIALISIPISVNLFATVLFRTEDFINLLYSFVLWFPLSLPLRLRRLLARVYQFGGVHSGSAIACTIWTMIFTFQVTRGFMTRDTTSVNVGIVLLTYLIQLMLVSIVVSAHPTIRRLQHNSFEAIHRFFGWLSLILFWSLAIVLSAAVAKKESVTLGYTLLRSPTIYFVAATTLLIILPWLRLRQITVHSVTPSDHLARLYLPGRKAHPTQTIRLSTAPLTEWHSFAILPPASGKYTDADPEKLEAGLQANSMSVLVSSAGDWTNSVIADEHATRKYWIRGVPTTGVTAVAQLFRKVVVVCTGSGIGPCLSLLCLAKAENHRTSYSLIWSTQAPEATYGSQVLEEVYDADPEALLWDTRVKGRPDLVALASETYERIGAEAVVVVSNQKVTKNVVFGLESLGVPAYGPIFDS